MEETPRIPLIVDSVKRARRGKPAMVRLSYHTVEREDYVLPHLVMEHLGVPLYIPDVGGGQAEVLAVPLLDSLENLDEVFDRFEAQDWFVDTQDLWLPFSVFHGEDPETGGVYRVGADLFRLGQAYGRGRITATDFPALAGEIEAAQLPVYSDADTRAVKAWMDSWIETLRNAHHASKDAGPEPGGPR
jgi:hypothetical protein